MVVSGEQRGGSKHPHRLELIHLWLVHEAIYLQNSDGLS